MRYLFRMNPYTLQFEKVRFKRLHLEMKGISRTFENNGKYYSIVQSNQKVSLFELHGAIATKITDLSVPQKTGISNFSIFIPYKESFLLMADGSDAALFKGIPE